MEDEKVALQVTPVDQDVNEDSSTDGASTSEIDERYSHSPPDGGFGWVIVAAAFMTSLIVDGIIFSFGILLPEILEEFQEGKSKSSWVGSLLAGMYLLIGPVVSALTNKFGCREIAIVGSLISCGAFVIASFAESILCLILVYGFVGGLGFGFVYLPSIVMIPFYFEKKRAFATGIAVCGSGIGTFIFSPFSQVLIDEYGWRGMLLIQSALILNCAAFSLFFKLPKVVNAPKEINNEEESTTNKSMLLRTKEARDKWHRISVGSEMTIDDGGNYVDRNGPITGNGRVSELSVDTNRNYPLEIVAEDATDSQQNTPIVRNWDRSRNNGVVKRRRTPIYNFVIEEDEGASKKKMSCMSLPWWNNSLPPRPVLPKVTSAALARPFYRPSIFMSGSLPIISGAYNTRAYASNVVVENLLPDETDNGKEMHNMRDTFKMMLDLSLFRSMTFVLICISGFLTFLGFFVPFVYISDFAVTTGVSKEKVSYLLSVIGIGNTVGRIFCGWVSDQPWASALYINSVALIIAGVATSCVPFCVDFGLQLAYSIVFGLAIACFVSLRSIILVEFHGVDKLSNAFGLTMLFQGIASMLGPPLAGWLYTVSNSYSMSFHIAGLIIAISGAIYLPLPCISAWEERRNKSL